MDGHIELSEWCDVPGYPRMQVGGDGSLRISKRDGSGWFEPSVGTPPSARYPMVRVWNGEAYTTKRVHELVALAWLGPAPPGQLIRHLNHDPQDWRPANLEHGTQRQNVYDCIEAGRHANAKASPKIAARIRRDYKPEKDSLADLAAKYGMTIRALRDILAGRAYSDIRPSKAEGYPMQKQSRRHK